MTLTSWAIWMSWTEVVPASKTLMTSSPSVSRSSKAHSIRMLAAAKPLVAQQPASMPCCPASKTMRLTQLSPRYHPLACWNR